MVKAAEKSLLWARIAYGASASIFCKKAPGKLFCKKAPGFIL